MAVAEHDAHNLRLRRKLERDPSTPACHSDRARCRGYSYCVIAVGRRTNVSGQCTMKKAAATMKMRTSGSNEGKGETLPLS